MVDMISSKYRCLDACPELVAYLKGVIAAPEDAKTYLLEGLKFILTLALIMATGVVLLMVG